LKQGATVALLVAAAAWKGFVKEEEDVVFYDPSQGKSVSSKDV
jgi:hypothetical protein